VSFQVRGFILNGADLGSDRAALVGWAADQVSDRAVEDPDAPPLEGAIAAALAALGDAAVRRVAAAAVTQRLETEPAADDGVVASLVAEGFEQNGAQRATLAAMRPELSLERTVVEARAWALQHQQDPDFASPVPFGWRPAPSDTRAFDSQFAAMGLGDEFPEGLPDRCGVIPPVISPVIS
jgi:hypothetical protein